MFFLISWYWEPEVFLVIFIIRPVYSSRFSFLFKVTVHLQGCRACKRCSASCLNCSYLNPYIKLKLIGLAIRLYQEFWKKMNCRIFHDFLIRAPESPFERYMSERILFFAYLMCSSVSGAKALKKRVCDLLYPISVKSYRTFSK